MQKADILANFERQMADYTQNVGKRIREARERIPDLSQEAAAREVGVSVKQFGRWERGESQPRRQEKWDRLAEVLGVSVDDLRGEPPEVYDPESELRMQVDRLEEKLDAILAALSSPASDALGSDVPLPPPRVPSPSESELPAPKTPGAMSGRAPDKTGSG